MTCPKYVVGVVEQPQNGRYREKCKAALRCTAGNLGTNSHCSTPRLSYAYGALDAYGRPTFLTGLSRSGRAYWG